MLPIITGLILAINLSVLIQYFRFIRRKEDILSFYNLKILEIIIVMGYPVLFLSIYDFNVPNDCCLSDSAFFSPVHRPTVYTLLILSTVAFIYSAFRQNLSPPLLELLINCGLITGLGLIIAVSLHVKEKIIYIPLTLLPLLLLYLFQLYRSYRFFEEEKETYYFDPEKWVVKAGFRLLNLPVWGKYPLLMILCLPLLLLFTGFMLLFGQKPDSLITAFTDTYGFGLSQLICTDDCPDQHFLCTIAAKGHKEVVKPVRNGARRGYLITVNRQLLIANAFEELMEEKVPYIHKPVRIIYNKIGGNSLKLYRIIGNRWISDLIYFMMKPLEYFFWITLSLTVKKPENKIASQYILHNDKAKIIA